MNLCISIKHPNSLLEKADEILMDYEDIDALFDISEKMPGKKVVIRIPKESQVDWNLIQVFTGKLDILIALQDFTYGPYCKENGIKFMWAYPVTNYDELNHLGAIGAAEVLVSGPLYFDLNEVSKRHMKIRLIANLCYDGYIPHANGINGTYVRPEDIETYEKYVSALEFRTDSLKREEILFEVYKEGSWKGNLNLLLDNLGFDVDNRGIPEEFADARLQCRWDCQRSSRCRFCYTAMNFSRAVDRNKKQWLTDK